MKTIKELSQELSVHRTTLNKAIERGDIPARKSGSILLVDDESEPFKCWLTKHNSRKVTSPAVPL